MEINPDFKYEVSISTQCFQNKPEGKDYAKMRWNPKTITMNEHIVFIQQGYSYCHIYKDNRRTNSNFRYTNSISIDVDDSSIPMQEYVSNLTYEPSFSYTTASNGIKGNRFRLVYCFKQKITSEYYCGIYNAILNRNQITDNQDDCGKTKAQMMNGNAKPDIQVYQSSLVYNIDDFVNLDGNTCTYTTDANTNKLLPNVSLELYNDNHIQQYISNDTNGSKDMNVVNAIVNKLNQYSKNKLRIEDIEQFFNQYYNIIDVYLHNTDEKFLQICFAKFKFSVYTETQVEFNADGFHIFTDDEDYYKLTNKFKVVEGKCHIRKHRDGEGRRKKLYSECCRLRLIKKDITFNELLYNTVFRRYWFYMNNDGVFNKEMMLGMVLNVWYKELDDIRCKNSNHPKLTTDKGYCLFYGLNRRAYSRKCVKKINQMEIGQWYDTGISISENFKLAKENGWFRGSLSSLRRFCIENSIDTNPKKIKIDEWYDENKTVDENYQWAIDNDIKTSLRSLYRYKKEIQRKRSFKKGT